MFFCDENSHCKKYVIFEKGRAGYKQHELQVSSEKYPSPQKKMAKRHLKSLSNMHILDIRLCHFYNVFNRLERSKKFTCIEYKKS